MDSWLVKLSDVPTGTRHSRWYNDRGTGKTTAPAEKILICCPLVRRRKKKSKTCTEEKIIVNLKKFRGKCFFILTRTPVCDLYSLRMHLLSLTHSSMFYILKVHFPLPPVIK